VPTTKKKTVASKKKSPKKALKISRVIKDEARNVEVDVTKKIMHVPNWVDWKERPTITLYEANCLIHNIFPSEDRVRRLKDAKDFRVKKFNTHLKTLKIQQPFQSKLIKVFAKDQDGKNATRVYLRNFIEWMKPPHIFGADLEPPPAFYALEQPLSSLPKATTILPMTGGATMLQRPDQSSSIQRRVPAQIVKQMVFDESQQGRTNSALLTVGLLMRYLQDLATDQVAPPGNLVRAKGTLNLSDLYTLIKPYTKDRTDQVSKKARQDASAAFETVRKVFRQAQAAFDKHFVFDKEQ
jgi:hypothetical protein